MELMFCALQRTTQAQSQRKCLFYVSVKIELGIMKRQQAHVIYIPLLYPNNT